jgi:hypothetical protein
MMIQFLTIATAMLAGSISGAQAAVFVPIVVSEPMSIALYGAGVGALYLIKKLRG